jgi:hypothetical protein
MLGMPVCARVIEGCGSINGEAEYSTISLMIFGMKYQAGLKLDMR